MKREPATVLADLVVRQDKSVVTKAGCEIYFPQRFVNKGLAKIGSTVESLALFGVVTQGKWALLNVNTKLRLKPKQILKAIEDGTDYYRLVFAPGGVVFESLEGVVDDSLLYPLYDELFSLGKVPWYMGYEDLANVFDTAAKYAGADVAKNPVTIQLLASLITRDPKDRMKYYRTAVESLADVKNIKPTFIPLKSVTYSASNTTNKFTGSYFSEAVTSSLINPSERTEKVEAILRK